ncbi:MAG: GGDEF domain-containing protein [Rudaea sp.]
MQQDRRSPRLIVVSGVMLGHQIELSSEPVVIGRAGECAISLQHPSVSRRHCRISLEDGRYHIEDLGSTNRTFLNGEAITRADLRDGDQIGVGQNALKFFVGASVEARYHRELIDLAIYDGLTGFHNRRHFRELLDEETEKGRTGTPPCLLMLDLDNFKALNDEHGHLVGDQVLAAVAEVVRENVLAGAPVGRLGGEEFALLLRDSSLAEAVAVAEQLREAIAARSISVGNHSLRVSVSIGVARLDPTPDSAALLRAADEQLYRAKEGGRNRVASRPAER